MARLDVVNLTDNIYQLRSGSGVGVNAAAIRRAARLLRLAESDVLNNRLANNPHGCKSNIARLRVERRTGAVLPVHGPPRAGTQTGLGEFDLHPFSADWHSSARGRASSPSSRSRPSGKRFPSLSSRRCCRRRPLPPNRSRHNQATSRVSSSPCRTRRTSISPCRPLARWSQTPRSPPRRRLSRGADRFALQHRRGR